MLLDECQLLANYKDKNRPLYVIRSESCESRSSNFAIIRNGFVHFKRGESLLIGCSYIDNRQKNLLVPVILTATRKDDVIPLISIIATCIVENGQHCIEFSGVPHAIVRAPSTIQCQNPSLPTFRYYESNKYEEFFRVYDSSTNYEYLVNVMDGMYDDHYNPIYSHVKMVSIKP